MPELSEIFSQCCNALRFNLLEDFFQLLDGMEGRFSPEEAEPLCAEAIQSRGFTPDMLEALLKRCPPPEEFFYRATPHQGAGGLVSLAAKYGRTELLDVLLRAGGDANRFVPGGRSPLEAALCSQRPASVLRLLQEPELDISATDEMLWLWSRLCDGLLDGGLSAEQRGLLHAISCLTEGDRDGAVRCLQPQARLPSGPPPIPRQLELRHAAQADLFPVVQTLCQRKRHLSTREASEALHLMQPGVLFPRHFVPLCQAVDSILSACPRALRRRYARRVLLLCCLRLDPDHLLDRWLARFPGRYLTLWPIRSGWLDWAGWDHSCSWAEPKGLLDQWRELPGGPLPALHRQRPLPEHLPLSPQAAAVYFERCTVLGNVRHGLLSPLARDALRLGDAALTAKLFRPGGALGTEEPGPLLDFVRSPECPAPNRAALLAVYPGRTGEEPYRL